MRIKPGNYLGGAIEVGAWLPLATDLAESGGEYSFTPVEGAVFHGVDLYAGDERIWAIAILDGRTAFTLPAVDSAPPTPDRIQVSALDGDLDVRDFAIEDVFERIERVSDQVAGL